MATHSSILAWRIPRTEQPGGLQSIESQRVRHDWVSPAAWSDWGLNHSWQAPGLLGSRLPHMTAIRVLPSSFVEQPPLKRSGAEVSSAFSSFNLHQVSSLPESLVQRLELLRITCFLYIWVSLTLFKGRWTLAFLFGPFSTPQLSVVFAILLMMNILLSRVSCFSVALAARLLCGENSVRTGK